MESYELGKDIQDIKSRLEKIEAALGVDMSTLNDSEAVLYSDSLAVPIDTFRDYMTFIVQQDLWDEVATLLQANGMRSVLLRGVQVNMICDFVAAKGAELSKDPQRAKALGPLPRCSIIKPPPKTPMTPPKK